MKHDIRKEIEHLKIFSKRLASSMIAGDYSAAFKGAGMDFDQIREYQSGDDVRFIDWNASAKTGDIMVKEFIPERDRTVIFAIDCSGSGLYGSGRLLKRDIMLRVYSGLSYIASKSNDRIGVLLFSDKVHRWFPPQRGQAHLVAILKELCSLSSQSHGTDISCALEFLIQLRRKNAILFFISDWIDGVVDKNYNRLLQIVACEYDMIGVRLLDQCESKDHFDGGTMLIEDPETGITCELRSSKVLAQQILKRAGEQKAMLEQAGVDLLDLSANQSIAHPIAQFFHRRIGRQI